MVLIHFWTWERVLSHTGQDNYVLVQLPFVVTRQEEPLARLPIGMP